MSLYRGVVRSLDGPRGPGVYVVVADVADGYPFGPCAVTETVARLGVDTGVSGAHAHDLAAALTPGQPVLVAQLGADATAFVIIDRLA